MFPLGPQIIRRARFWAWEALPRGETESRGTNEERPRVIPRAHMSASSKTFVLGPLREICVAGGSVPEFERPLDKYSTARKPLHLRIAVSDRI